MHYRLSNQISLFSYILYKIVQLQQQGNFKQTTNKVALTLFYKTKTMHTYKEINKLLKVQQAWSLDKNTSLFFLVGRSKDFLGELR